MPQSADWPGLTQGWPRRNWSRWIAFGLATIAIVLVLAALTQGEEGQDEERTDCERGSALAYLERAEVQIGEITVAYGLLSNMIAMSSSPEVLASPVLRQTVAQTLARIARAGDALVEMEAPYALRHVQHEAAEMGRDARQGAALFAQGIDRRDLATLEAANARMAESTMHGDNLVAFMGFACQ